MKHGSSCRNSKCSIPSKERDQIRQHYSLDQRDEDKCPRILIVASDVVDERESRPLSTPAVTRLHKIDANISEPANAQNRVRFKTRVAVTRLYKKDAW